MSTQQLDLLAITNEAIGRARDHADTPWLRDAYKAVKTLAGWGQPFTTDDVWALLEKVSIAATHEPRALGAVMRQAQREGLIRSTGTWQKTTRPQAHTRPCAVWIGTSLAVA